MSNYMQAVTKRHQSVSTWRAFAYACNRAWICLMFFSSILFMNLPADMRWGSSETMYLISVITLAFSLAVFGLLCQPITRLLDTRWGGYVGPCICAGSILAPTGNLLAGQVPSTLGIIIMAIGTGIGSSLVLLNIGRSYQATPTRVCAMEVLGATAIAATVAIALYFAPIEAAFATALLLPFCAAFCVRKARGILVASVTNKESLGESISSNLVLKFIVAAFVIGITTGFMRDTFTMHSNDAFSIDNFLLFMISSIVAIVVLLPAVVMKKTFSIKLLYKPAILVCVLGFAIAPSFGLGTAVPYMLVNIGYSAFEIMIWVVLCDIANRFQFTFLQVFGIGRATTLALGVGLGSVVSRCCAGLTATSANFSILTAGIAVSAITASYLYVLTENDLDAYSSLSVAGEGTAEEERARPTGTADTPGPGGRGVGGVEAPQKKIPLLERCKIIGEYYGLSKREIDVFHLLAIGRKATRIQEELVISAGTVNTHTYHIYTKMGVHSQQELIDLMQAANLDEMKAELAKR